VATTLNNLASFNIAIRQIEKAQAHASEAESIIEPIWSANPVLRGDLMAKVFLNLAFIAEATGQPAKAQAFAHRALTATYDPDLKRGTQDYIDRLCPEPSG
jgi:hypothetical protein